MTAYAYGHAAPFKIAQRYDYADCASVSFIEDWRSFRRQACKKFQVRAEQAAEVVDVAIADELSLSRLMEKCMAPEGCDLLWKFIKKYEVFGRLHSRYQDDMTKHPESTPARFSDYISFGEALVFHAQDGRCLQYLSTLLKLLDSLSMITPREVSPPEAQRIVGLYKAEQDMVEELAHDRL